MIGDGEADRDHRDDSNPYRGCAVGALLVVGAVVLVLAVLALAGCSSRPDLPRGSSSPPTATSTGAGVVDPVEVVLDAAWRAGRHGCGEPTQIAVDDLAAALIEQLDAPRLDARLAAGQYVRARCRR